MSLIGIATWNFREHDLPQRIDRFAAMGFDAVSLVEHDATLLCRGETPEVQEAIDRNSLAVTIHGSMAGADRAVDEARLLADFESYLAWHARTGALNSVNYDGVSRKTDTGFEYCAKEMSGILRKLLRMSQGTGIAVGVEDWPRNAEMLKSVADLADFSHYGLLIDLGHMNMRIGNNDPDAPYPLEAAKRYLDDIVLPVNEVHIHNNDGLHDFHAPFDAGTADLQAVADLIKPKCSRAVFTSEIVPSFCGITEEQAISASADILRIWRSLMSEL